MATIVNTPGSTTDNSGLGMLVGVLLVIATVVLLLYFAAPALRSLRAPSAQISVPEQVDVNVNSGGQPAGGQQ